MRTSPKYRVAELMSYFQWINDAVKIMKDAEKWGQWTKAEKINQLKLFVHKAEEKRACFNETYAGIKG